MSIATVDGEKRGAPWKARAFVRGDEKALADLYETVLERPFDALKWEWHFAGVASVPGYIMLADHDGTLAGQYAVVPVRMQIQGERTRAALSLDTMTHPGYRKQGVFVALAREVYARTAELGARLVYGFPNHRSYHGLVERLDWFVLDMLPTMTRPVDTAAILKCKTKTGVLATIVGKPLQGLFDLLLRRPVRDGSIRVERATRFPEAVNDLFKRVSGRFRNMVVRDFDYLKWRYDEHPTYSYDRYFAWRDGQLAGYCVTGETERRGLSIGIIVDFLADPEDDEAVAALGKAALDGIRRTGAMTAAVVLVPGSPFLATFRKLGFIIPVRPFPFTVRPGPGLDREAVSRPGDWHITLGDGDFV